MDDQEQPFDPKFNEWFEFTIKVRFPVHGYLIGTLSNSETVFVHDRKITLAPGQHYCFLEPTLTGIARMKKSDPSKRCEYEALEARFEYEPPNRVEIATVDQWFGKYGSLKRDCGCTIFGHGDGLEHLRVGNVVEFDIEENELKGWSAENIRPPHKLGEEA